MASCIVVTLVSRSAITRWIDTFITVESRTITNWPEHRAMSTAHLKRWVFSTGREYGARVGVGSGGQRPGSVEMASAVPDRGGVGGAAGTTLDAVWMGPTRGRSVAGMDLTDF